MRRQRIEMYLSEPQTEALKTLADEGGYKVATLLRDVVVDFLERRGALPRGDAVIERDRLFERFGDDVAPLLAELLTDRWEMAVEAGDLVLRSSPSIEPERLRAHVATVYSRFGCLVDLQRADGQVVVRIEAGGGQMHRELCPVGGQEHP